MATIAPARIDSSEVDNLAGELAIKIGSLCRAVDDLTEQQRRQNGDVRETRRELSDARGEIATLKNWIMSQLAMFALGAIGIIVTLIVR